MVLSSSTAKDFSSPALSAKSLRVFRYDNYTFSVSAIHKSGNTIILLQSMIQYSCDSRIGTITSYGVFTPSSQPDSGYVYARLNSATDSCFVKTYDFKYFVLTPKLAVTDTLRTLNLSINVYDADSVQHYLPIAWFKLVSTNPSVGTIDSMGTFTAKQNGTTYVIASFHNYSDTSVIRVESASGLVSFEQFESLSGWTFSGVNLDSLSVTLSTDQKSQGNASFEIYYKFTYDPSKPSYMVYLNKDLPVFGIPDSIYLDVKSDGRRHRLYYRFTDADSAAFRASGRKYLNDSLSFDDVDAAMTGLLPQSGIPQVSYPLTLRRIEIQLAGTNVQGVSTSGTIYVDNLRLKYPGNVSLWVEKMPPAPHRFRLEQNYPNPFNPTTNIRFKVSSSGFVSLKVYDVLGRLVRTLVDEVKKPGIYEVEFEGGNLASGVYFYRLDAGPYHDTKKLVLLR